MKNRQHPAMDRVMEAFRAYTMNPPYPRCPHYPRKRTWEASLVMSAKGPIGDVSRLLNNLIDLCQQGW